MPADPPSFLASVDRATFVVALAERLRGAGLRPGTKAVGDLARAFAVAMPVTTSQAYWTTRVCLVHDHADLEAFDRVFAAVFDDAILYDATRGQAPSSMAARTVPDDEGEDVPPAAGGGTPLPWTTLPAGRLSEDGGAADPASAVPELRASAVEALLDLPLDRLTAEQVAMLTAWLVHAARRWPRRRTRRQQVHPSGRQVALRPTIARARRTGWDPVELARTRAVERPRRVVMLCDVSRSMQAHAGAYLHLMHAIAITRPDAELFAFATRLTRVTPLLRHRSAEAAVALAAERVSDRLGGTRIASCIGELLASRHADAVRGAVVLIGSDGWDSEPPEAIDAAMARLRRRAHRIVWLNPRAGAPGWTPTVSTMAAALPYCDRLLAAHTFRALEHALGEIAGLNSRA